MKEYKFISTSGIFNPPPNEKKIAKKCQGKYFSMCRAIFTQRTFTRCRKKQRLRNANKYLTEQFLLIWAIGWNGKRDNSVCETINCSLRLLRKKSFRGWFCWDLNEKDKPWKQVLTDLQVLKIKRDKVEHFAFIKLEKSVYCLHFPKASARMKNW